MDYLVFFLFEYQLLTVWEMVGQRPRLLRLARAQQLLYDEAKLLPAVESLRVGKGRRGLGHQVQLQAKMSINI